MSERDHSEQNGIIRSANTDIRGNDTCTPLTSFAQNLQTVDGRVACVPTSTLLNQARGVLYSYMPHTVPNNQIPPQQSQNIMSNGIHEQDWVDVNTGQWR